jgi:Protein of unknown function (DUF2961)
VHGAGKYVGTYLAWGANHPGWWGEGEVKFYFDGDEEFPTICGTGTEDYFGGAWNFDVPGQGYTTYSTPFLGAASSHPPGRAVSQPAGAQAAQGAPNEFRRNPPLRRCDGEEAPFAGHALELMNATLLELDP